MAPYTPPSLVELGSVAQMTASTSDSSRIDIFFGTSGPAQQGTGSFDGCITFPGTSDCVNPEAP